ncbi:MAG TPA: two-component regulator propeller domain-containing protein [Blastocatellia bacterium]|nr:two-component regulator propeller domain-containing protein [Blastocatellia bacterium]
MNDGLPQNSVYAIHQTRDGYLWIATLDGLARFDGVRFTVFNKTNMPGITSNRFISLYEGPQGDLWIGTVNGVVTRYHNGIFTSYSTDQGFSNNPVWAITGDDHGNVWVLSDRQVLRWDNGKFLPVTDDDLVLNFAVVQRDGRGGFWGRTGVGDLVLFSHGQLGTVRLPGTPEPSSSTRASVAEDSQGSVWVATSAGLASIRDGKLVKLYTPQDGLPSNDLFFISGPELKIACFDKNNDLVILGQDSPDASGPWVKRSIVRKPPDNLSRRFYGFYEDREGNIWIATNKNGIFRAQRQAIKFYSKADGLIDTNIYPIYEDRTGAVWVGAWPSNVSRFKDNVWTNYSLDLGTPTSQATGLCTALYEDRTDDLWVASYGRGLNGLTHQRDRGFTDANDLPFFDAGAISAIHQDRDGALWFGGERRLIRYSNGTSTSFTKQDGLAGNNVKVIVGDLDGGLWIGTYTGLSHWQNGRFVSYTEKQGLPSDDVWALYQDREGVLWIGTYDGGLGRFKDGRFTRFITRDGLFDNGVFQILEDDRGYFWMSSNHGIYRVSRQELNEFADGNRRTITSVAFGKDDGLLSITCNGGRSPAGIRASDGKLWFPTQEGVAVVDPEALPINLQPPPVVIESIKLDRAAVAFDHPIKVASSQGEVEIEYTALSLINSDRIQFKYKLEGLNPEWISAGTRRTAYYSHLPPGNYTFRIIAANSDGVWNEQGQSLRIIVLPPFYLTWWFLSLVALAAGLLVWFGYRYRIIQLKRAQAAQQTFSRQLIASQEAERKRIAAELHDGLGQNLLIVKNRAQLGQMGAQDTPELLEQFEWIISSATQSIEEVREIAQNLRPYHLDRLGLTEALEIMIEKVAATTKIKVVSELVPLDDLFNKEEEITLYRVVQESFNNIVKHAQASEVRVSVERLTDSLTLTIHDNGRGFSVSEAAAKTSGFGLAGMAERVRMLSGEWQIESHEKQGTIVTIRLTLPITRRKSDGG